MARRPGIGRSVEGVHAVSAAVASGRVRQVWVEAARRSQGVTSAILDQARSQGIPVRVVESLAERAITDAPQGIVAEAEPISTVTLEELAGTDLPALIVLDHLEDPHNLGAIARSAAAAGMTGLVASDRRAAPFGPTAFKAAAGALERIAVSIISSVPAALERLHRLGVWTVGLAPDGTDRLFGLSLLDQPVAVVVGAEGQGLAPLTAERCDVLASVPMASGESLNASVAAAIASYEVMRVRSQL